MIYPNKMKLKHLLIILISLSLFSCEKEVEFTFENPLSVERIDEVIVMTRADLADKIDIQEGMLPVFKIFFIVYFQLYRTNTFP